jgi:hypothetical protein
MRRADFKALLQSKLSFASLPTEHDALARAGDLVSAWKARTTDADETWGSPGPHHEIRLRVNFAPVDLPATSSKTDALWLTFNELSLKLSGKLEADHPDKLSPPPAPAPTALDSLPILPTISTVPNIVESIDAINDTTTPYALLVGQTAQGNIGFNADRDWFSVDLVAGQTYSFALVGTGVFNLVDPYLRLTTTAYPTTIPFSRTPPPAAAPTTS